MSFKRGSRHTLILFSAFVLVVVGFAVAAVTAGPNDRVSNKIDASLAAKLGSADPGAVFDVIIKLRPVDTAGLSGKGRSNDFSSADNLRLLKSTTFKAQKNVWSLIKDGESVGRVKSTRRFWITNAVRIKADAATVKSLALQADVEAVFLNFRVGLIDPLPTAERGTAQAGFRPAGGNEWNLNAIDAPAVWSGLSTEGTGTTVAVLDTGIDDTHPDLVGKVDQFVTIGTDGIATTATAEDAIGHGTHVAGVIAGGNAGGTAIGVAPETRLLGVNVMPKGFGTFAQILGGMEWAADPDGNPATDDQPDAVNMSLGGPGLAAQMFEPVDNLVAAGVFPAIAVGNDGPGSVGSPADVPSAFAVGAVGKTDEIAWFSGGEEVEWFDPPHEGVYIKPDAAAPGVEIRSSVPKNGYERWSGTSMATPHVAGTVALLRSLDASLTVGQMSAILRATAVDLGSEGKDVRYGNGRIDAFAAASLALSFAGVEGTVTAAGETTAATIKVVAEPTGTVVSSVAAGGDGRYQVAAAPGQYRIEVSKHGYDTTSSPIFDLAAGDTTVFSPALTAGEKYRLSGTVTQSGGVIAESTVTILSPVKLAVPTLSGAYSFDVPNGVYRVRAEAFGFRNSDATITISGGNASQSFVLSKVQPTLLVIDVAAGPYAKFFDAALTAAGVPYDRLDLSDVERSASSATYRLLSQYRQVVWAAGDGPATGAWPDFGDFDDVPANPAIADYLDNGGKLLLTGQDIAIYVVWYNSRAIPADFGAPPMPEPMDFLGKYLHARLIKNKANNLTLKGAAGGLLSGETMDLLGGNGADNQLAPDVIGPDADARADLFYSKETTGAAALRAYSGKENNGKVVYFGFGLEGLDTTEARTLAMSRSLGWLGAAPGSLSINPSTTKIKGVGSVVLSGTLGPAAAGETVTLQQKTVINDLFSEDDFLDEDWGDEGLGFGGDEGSSAAPITVWTPVAEVKTGAGGVWRAEATPMSNASYRAVWQGSAQYSRTVSSEVSVRVRPIFTLFRPGGRTPAGSVAYLEGMVSPPTDNLNVTVQRRLPGTRRWRFEETDVELEPGGFFRIPVKPTRHTQYRLISEGGEDFMRASSAPTEIRTKHNLTIKAESPLISRGVPIIFNGKLGARHSGTLQFQQLNGTSWTTVGTVTLANQSRWEVRHAGSETGSFKFRVKLNRDIQHATGASKPVKVRFY